MAVNYVRFLRGTPTAFEKVIEKNPDTLYFISETDNSPGDLYLGSKLIAGNSLLSTLSLTDLSDIITDSSGDSGSLLVYDNTSRTWKQMSPSEIAQSIYFVMTGATAQFDGKSGLVPVPKAGQQDLFLRADASWANPTKGISEQLQKLIGKDTDKATFRDIAVSVLSELLIPENAQESLDTLKEISEWIQKNPQTLTDLTSRVENLETVTTNQGNNITILNSTVGNLSNSLSNLTSDVKDIKEDITTLYDRLTWQDIK